jgi:hypothetical protein
MGRAQLLDDRMKKKIFNLLTRTVYDNSTGWKLDADGHIVLKDGNPVYLNSSGQELSIAPDTITRLNSEAKTHREAKENAVNALKAFEGLDALQARKAIETVTKLDAKQLIDAGKVDELKHQITSQFTTQITEKEKAYAELQSKYDSILINNIFAGSEFLRNNIAVPRDMLEATFRNNFKVEDGQVHGYGKDGNRLLSKSKHGEYATAEEALQLLVEAHPQKDIIMKADLGSGSGSGGNGGNRVNNNVVMKRADFDKLPPVSQAEIAGKLRTGEMQLTD